MFFWFITYAPYVTISHDNKSASVQRTRKQEHVELKLLIKSKQKQITLINNKKKVKTNITVQSFKSIGIEYRQILALKSIGDTTIDTAFENYRRYCDRYRKSIGDTADTDTLSPILTTLLACYFKPYNFFKC